MIYCRAARAVGYLVAQYRGPASERLGNKNGAFLGQLVEKNDHKYAFRKPFQNFGKIRIFVRWNKNGPFLGQLVENNDHKYAFRKPFQNFGKIRIFV